jgi:hypothetical protein
MKKQSTLGGSFSSRNKTPLKGSFAYSSTNSLTTKSRIEENKGEGIRKNTPLKG